MSAPTTSSSVLPSQLGDALTLLPSESHASLVQLLPETPWTTTALNLLQRRQSKVFVDAPDGPQSLIVVAHGDPATRTPDEVYLFGTPESAALRTFITAIRGPISLVCDDAIGALVKEAHPDARENDAVVHWYETMADAEAVEAEPGPRRLRISEADALAELLPGWAMRVHRTAKELVTGSSVYVIEEDGRLAAAAFGMDQSFKHERICVVTAPDRRRSGLGLRVAKKLVRAITDQSRIVCAVVDRRDAAGLALADKLQFTRKARLRRFVTALKK